MVIKIVLSLVNALTTKPEQSPEILFLSLCFGHNKLCIYFDREIGRKKRNTERKRMEEHEEEEKNELCYACNTAVL